jgi:WD40 repeat protein
LALGMHCWVGLNSGKLLCLDLISHEVLERDHDFEVKCLCSSGGYVWAGCSEGMLVMLEGCSGGIGPLKLGKGDITCILSLSHDLLLVGDSGGGLHLLSVEQHEVVARCSVGTRKAVVHGCAVTETLAWITVAPSDLYCVNVEKGQEGFSLTASLLHRLGQAEVVTGMICAGSHVWTSGNDIRVWDAKTAALLLTLPTDKVHCMSAVSFHGVATIRAGQTGRIIIWDVKKRVMVRTLECEGNVHRILQVGVDSAWVGTRTGSNDGTLLEWTSL